MEEVGVLDEAIGGGGLRLGGLDDGLKLSMEASGLSVIRHGGRTGQRTGGG
jgi:hypothetical protein